MYNLKIEITFYLAALLSTITWGGSFSDSSEGLFQKVREESGYIEIFAEKKTKQTHLVERRKITANHKNQTSQVNNFCAFLCMGRHKSLDWLKLFFWSASYLSRTRILFFLLPGVLLGWLQWLMFRWLKHPLFTEMAGSFVHNSFSGFQICNTALLTIVPCLCYIPITYL